jgi:hypothetical protein
MSPHAVGASYSIGPDAWARVVEIRVLGGGWSIRHEVAYGRGAFGLYDHVYLDRPDGTTTHAHWWSMAQAESEWLRTMVSDMAYRTWDGLVARGVIRPELGFAGRDRHGV